MKVFPTVCLMVACPLSTAATPGEQCDTFRLTDDVSSPPTVEEIENQAMADIEAWRKDGLPIPKVLFGYMNSKWLALKSMLQPGDEIVRYSTDKSSWQGRRGEKGVALVRSGCIVDRLVTAQS